MVSVVSMAVKLKRKILPPEAEGLPYSVLLISAGHHSLSLSPPFSLGGNVGNCSTFSLKAKLLKAKVTRTENVFLDLVFSELLGQDLGNISTIMCY